MLRHLVVPILDTVLLEMAFFTPRAIYILFFDLPFFLSVTGPLRDIGTKLNPSKTENPPQASQSAFRLVLKSDIHE